MAESETRKPADLLASQALSIMVADLGYGVEGKSLPRNGWNPIRHQIMWHLIEETLGKAWVREEIASCLECVATEAAQDALKASQRAVKGES